MTRPLAAAAVLAAAVLFAPPTLADDLPKKENPFTGKPLDAKKAEDRKPTPKAPAEPDVRSARVAHIKLTGDLDESPVEAEPLFGAPPENLRIKLNRIREAAKDDRIDALYLELGSLEVGFAKLHEIKAAIAEFRKTGKKTFAYAEEYSTKSYLIGLACDQLVVPESGGVNLYGLRAEVTFYKNTLDLLKLKADVLKMGDFKAAVEPFISDKMSDANRQQITSMLDDNYDHEIVAAIVAARPARKFTREHVQAIVDQGPFTAKKAAEKGLVDAVAYEDQLDGMIAKALGVDVVRMQKNYGKAKATELDLSNPFALLSAMSGPKKPRETKEPKIAVIYAVGGIASGKSSVDPLLGGATIGSETLVAAIREADKNETVKAIVLRIDSPGGSALASDIIWRALTQCKKPVVASMGDVAASGGYYIAAAGKKIYAEPGTVTGSIGVFGLKLVTGGLEEWAGMKTEVIGRGKNSGVNSTTFPWTPSEKEAMNAVIEEVYDQFLGRALQGRKNAGSKMTRDELVALAGGRVWTGRQAKANGLVDELGTLNDAIAGAKQFAGIDPKKEMELLILPKAQTFLDKLADGEMPFPLGNLRAVPGATKALRLVGPLLRTHRDPVKVMLPYAVEWK